MASPPPNQGPGGPYGDPNAYQYGQPQQPYAQPDPYAQQQQQQQSYGQPGYTPQGYPPTGAPTPPNAGPPPPGSAAGGHGGKTRRRGYAEEQYDFGAGANAAGTPSSQGGMPGVGMGGYPGPQQEQQTQFISPMGGASPAMGMQQPGYGMQPGLSGVGAGNIQTGGYELPGAPGMAGVTQQFGQMGLGQQAGIQKPQALNHLYSVDLMQQPFNVAELEFPPPEIVLPPNVWHGSLFGLYGMLM